MERINIGYDVIEVDKGQTFIHVIGTGMFPITEGRLESEKFFSDMHGMFSTCHHAEMLMYEKKYDSDKPMKGYLRQIVLYPSISEDTWKESMAHLGAIMMHIHVNKNKCNIIGFVNIYDFEYEGEFGDKKFLKSVAKAVKSEYANKISEGVERAKEYAEKYQKPALNNNICNVSYEFAYEMPQRKYKPLTKNQKEAICELLQ